MDEQTRKNNIHKWGIKKPSKTNKGDSRLKTGANILYISRINQSYSVYFLNRQFLFPSFVWFVFSSNWIENCISPLKIRLSIVWILSLYTDLLYLIYSNWDLCLTFFCINRYFLHSHFFLYISKCSCLQCPQLIKMQHTMTIKPTAR